MLSIVFQSFSSYSQALINSFEQESNLENVTVTEGVDISRSTDFPALGAYSCKTVFPDDGGTVYLNNINTFFRRNVENSGLDYNEVLLYFIWTNEVANISLIVEDSSGQSFNKQYALKQGANHLQLLFSEAEKFDLKRIKSIGLRTNKANIFYLDYITLDQYQPVLTKLGRWEVEYSTDIKTPHFPWGADLAGGSIRSYSISPIFDGRGIVELAERLDLDIEVSTIGRYGGAEKYGYGDFYMRRSPGHGGDSTTYNLAHKYIATDLLFDPEYDVIIWPGLHKWESYPEPVRKAIMERVEKGTGLVLLYPVGEENSDLWDISPLKSADAYDAQEKIKDSEISTIPEKFDRSKWEPTTAHYITNGVAFEAFPTGHIGVYPYQNVSGEVLIESTGGNPVLAVSNYGKGRVVAMAYTERGFLPRVDDPWETGLNYPYWEYMWSMVARSVVWASGREPETTIKEVRRTDEGFSVDLANVLTNLNLNFQVTDDFGIVEEETSISLHEGQTTIDIKLVNKLNGGKHLVKIQLAGNEGVHDWHSIVFHTEHSAEIGSVENEQLEIPVGEEVRSTLVLKSDKAVTGTLTSRLYDNYGRLVDENYREVSFEGTKSYETVLNSGNVLTNLARSEFILHVDGNQVDHKVAEVFFLQPRIWDDYDVTMYHFGPNPVPGTWEAVDQQLRELNVTTLAAYTLTNSKHANYKVQAQTRIKGVESPDSGPDRKYYEEMKIKYLETNDKHLLKRKYGLKDPVYLDSLRNHLTTMVKQWKKFSPSAYYIYEEPSITRYDDALDLCFRESTLKAMREWLKEEYVTLEALNDQWGTDFNQWQNVIPDDSREARERGNYSSWADHRTFMEICWADQFKFVQDIVNEVDPGGLVQLSGTQAASSHNGYDYSRLNKYVGQMNPYDIDNQLEYHHNFNPDLILSGQAGYGALGKGVLYDYYNNLFLKETGGSYVFWQVSCLNPDLRLCQSGVDLKNGFDEILKRGIGRLIGSYEPDNELKIAIHFSYPSVHAAWIVDGIIVPETGDNVSETLKQFNRNRDGWVKILHDAGFGFDFIAYSDIEQGGLQSEAYNVLILPMSYALSDQEVRHIEKFVDNGGILIADALPGVMDDHNKFRSKRALSEVFGIKAKAYNREELITPQSESGLKIKKAKVLINGTNGTQLLYNKYGQGSAFLLNYFMNNYPEEKSLGENELSLLKFRKIFEKENLQSSIHLTNVEGDPADVEVYAFSEQGGGSARLLGLLPGKSGENREINLHVDHSVHLYDIRNKKYLGAGKMHPIKLRTSVPELFALTKSKIENFYLQVPSSVKRGEVVSINFNVVEEEISNLKSVVRIDVYDPDGTYIQYYSSNSDITNGSGSYSFRTAMNDLPGVWKIRFTEVISSIEKEVMVTIK